MFVRYLLWITRGERHNVYNLINLSVYDNTILPAVHECREYSVFCMITQSSDSARLTFKMTMSDVCFPTLLLAVQLYFPASDAFPMS